MTNMTDGAVAVGTAAGAAGWAIGEWGTEQERPPCRPRRRPDRQPPTARPRDRPTSGATRYAGSVHPVPGSVTLATLSMGTLLRPPATSLTSRM